MTCASVTYRFRGRHLQVFSGPMTRPGASFPAGLVRDGQHAEPAPVGEASEPPSRLQRSLGSSGTNMGLRVPRARFRPPRFRTCSFSSRYRRLSFFLCTHCPAGDLAKPNQPRAGQPCRSSITGTRRLPNRRRSAATTLIALRNSASSGSTLWRRTLDRSTPSTEHARRGLTSCSLHRCATASRFA